MSRILKNPLVFSILMFSAFSAYAQSPTINWAGMEWEVKASARPLPPGPNYFSRSSESVFIDERGLHLVIRRQKARWFCSEITSVKQMGYGTYRLSLTADLKTFPPQAVFGFFTWSSSPEFFHRELDIELSSWNHYSSPVCQFTVQPFDLPENNHRFPVADGIKSFIMVINRTPEKVIFILENSAAGEIIDTWEYPGGFPEGDEHLRFNFWLYKGSTENLEEAAEVILTDFKFSPYHDEGSK